MKELIKASLRISKAIKWDTEIWFTEGNILDFSTLSNSATVAVIYLDVSDSISEGRNVVTCRLNDLKSWIKHNKNNVEVNGSKISLKVEGIYSFSFAKFREVKISRWEEPKPMEQIVPNGLKQISVEVRKGVFVDLLLDSKSGKHYTWNWELGIKYKGIEYSKAIEDSELVEFKAIGFT